MALNGYAMKTSLGAYRTTQLFRKARSTLVLSNRGHIQSRINPPANQRSWIVGGPARAATPQTWLAGRDEHDGRCWPHRREWICARSGKRKPAPAALGSKRHPT
jgi:polyhydroxyalkanoate synthase subunit PhaC